MKIFNLYSNSSPKEGCYYIFDSNVWLPLLGLDSENLSDHYKVFFGKIFKTDGAKILLCPLQLSEILNKLLHYHSKKAYDKKYKSYKGEKPSPYSFYKDEYRSSPDFKLQYASIIDDIDQYAERLVICDIGNKDFEILTSFAAHSLDFNDNYLYLLAQEHKATIITHDGDFYDLDVPVGTYNKTLYNKYKNSVIPIIK